VHKMESGLLPKQNEIESILALNWGGEVAEVMDSYLLNPLREFLDRPSKKIRGRMVEIGFRLAAGGDVETEFLKNRQWIESASNLLESLHSASLIIDDIQDNSHERRGEPTVHRKHGMPLALNAGNWLYFWPLQNIDEWDVEDSVKLRVYRVCHKGLLRAHFGQALDVGLNIFDVPQNKIKSTCLASLELKSGALMAMALSLGAVLGSKNRELDIICDRFGHAFGIALQMFDDAGNASQKGPKQYEDLLLKRPSWLVAVAAHYLSESDFQRFKNATILLPNTESLENLLKELGLIDLARIEAKKYLEQSLKLLNHPYLETKASVKKQIQELADLLVRAYV